MGAQVIVKIYKKFVRFELATATSQSLKYHVIIFFQHV